MSTKAKPVTGAGIPPRITMQDAVDICYAGLNTGLTSAEKSQTIERTTEDQLRFQRDMARIQCSEFLGLVKEMLPDFESGYIANPSGRADAKRLKYENKIRRLIAKAEGRAE